MSKADPKIVVKRDENEYLEWLATDAGFLQAFGSVDDEPIVWEDFQLDYFHDTSRFYHCNKSRQIGFSFAVAGKCLARAHIRNGYTAVIVSYNLDESQEKIRYAKAFYENLPLEFQRPIERSSLSLLEFKGSGRKRGSRIKSFPSKAPRGKCGDIILDEFAHYPKDEAVLTGSNGNISRIKGAQLAMVSTPLGNRGMFWEVGSEFNKAYPDYKRVELPWWLCIAFCKNVPLARDVAPSLSTEDRVERFGTDHLKEQYRNALSDEDFQQEFECLYQDDQVSFYPYDIIQPCTSDSLRVATELDQIGDAQHHVTRFHGGLLRAGYDVGRDRDKSVLTVYERNDSKGRWELRLKVELVKTRLPDQTNFLCRVMDTLPISMLVIDGTGIGQHIAEEIEDRYPNRTVWHKFTNAAKAKWCINFKILLQKTEILIPRDRSIVNQIHSIRRQHTSAGNVIFNSGRATAEGHADFFWSTVLALEPMAGIQAVEESKPYELDVMIIGPKKNGNPASRGFQKSKTGRLWIPTL